SVSRHSRWARARHSRFASVRCPRRERQRHRRAPHSGAGAGVAGWRRDVRGRSLRDIEGETKLDETVSLPAILGRSRPALARAVTVFENDRPRADELHAALASHLGRAHVVGITGAPGAGKSTLIDALLGALVAHGRSVAVVAVDPSSPVSGGAILGDRVRMGDVASHEDVFVRSLSSRGHRGGLSRAAARFIELFDAASFDIVLGETVRTSQSKVAMLWVAATERLW